MPRRSGLAETRRLDDERRRVPITATAAGVRCTFMSPSIVARRPDTAPCSKAFPSCARLTRGKSGAFTHQFAETGAGPLERHPGLDLDPACRDLARLGIDAGLARDEVQIAGSDRMRVRTETRQYRGAAQRTGAARGTAW